MSNKIYELGCKTGLINYIDHETPRFYFINANADLDDFDAFCAEITEEYAAEIERLRSALDETRRFALSGEMDTIVSDEIELLREALQKARNTLAGLGYPSIAADICDTALGEKE